MARRFSRSRRPRERACASPVGLLKTELLLNKNITPHPVSFRHQARCRADSQAPPGRQRQNRPVAAVDQLTADACITGLTHRGDWRATGEWPAPNPKVRSSQLVLDQYVSMHDRRRRSQVSGRETGQREMRTDLLSRSQRNRYRRFNRLEQDLRPVSGAAYSARQQKAEPSPLVHLLLAAS